MSSLALSSPVLSSSSIDSHPFPHSSHLCCRTFDGAPPARCLARSSPAAVPVPVPVLVPRSLLLPSCFELASSRCPKIFAGGGLHDCRSGHRNRTRASAAVDENGPGSEETSSSRTTVEQGKRILALQKDLLDQKLSSELHREERKEKGDSSQEITPLNAREDMDASMMEIAERKKLVTALKENLGHAAEQVKAYNNSEARSIESNFSQDEPMPEIVGSGSSPVWDVSSVGNKADTGAQYDAAVKMNKTKLDVKTSSSIPLAGTERQSGFNSESGRKAFESEIKSLSPASLADIFSSSKSAGVSSPVQSSPPLGVKKKVSYIEEQKSSPDEPAVATSSSSVNKAAPPLAGQNVMNVILAAAECYPWSKTGGLGDVAGALPRALARRGHRVMVVAPRYRSYPEAWDTKIRKRYNIAGQELEVGYFHGFIDGVDHVFIDNSTFHGFADNIYGGNREDVLKRMALFCKAVIEVPWHVPCGGVCYGDGNLAFIANDWHTALIPVYLQAYYRDNGLMNFARSILVIHNIAHQGRGPLSDFSLLGLPDHYIDKFRLYDPIGGEHSNVFMAGLLTAHRIVAVSHGYAWECQTQLGGWGLDGVVREHNWKLRGIVNGIDDKEWSPELDIHLQTDGYSNYSPKTLHSGKALCKAALQKELGLPVRNDVPLLGFIGRLDHQKGVDIIADAMHWMMEQDLQLVLLGTGRADLENMLHNFENQHRHKVRAWVGFSVKTAHRITAGSDILVMPSRFEPCGLNQLYAMRYGTVPVVHAVGGLRDTVITFDPYSNTGTGWTFSKAEASELIHALGNAMWTFRDFKESWRGIQERGMTQDLSWDQAAKQYEEVMVAAKYQW